MFDYPCFYEHLVASAPKGSTIVEVGCYIGESLSYLAGLAQSKGIRVVGVDWGLGMPDTNAPPGVVRSVVPTANALALNLQKAGIPGGIPVIMWDSAMSAQFFPDRSCFAVFIDAAHDMYSVRRDIRYWAPKIQRGGILCGHDYDWDGVKEAVDMDFGPCESKYHNRCWEVRRTMWGWK